VQCFSTFSVKRNPLRELWLLTEAMSFGGGGTLEARRAEAEGQEWGVVLEKGQGAPSPPAIGIEGRCCKLPHQGLGRSPDCGYIEDLLRASKTRHKYRMQFNFFTDHRQSRRMLGYHLWDPYTGLV